MSIFSVHNLKQSETSGLIERVSLSFRFNLQCCELTESEASSSSFDGL